MENNKIEKTNLENSELAGGKSYRARPNELKASKIVLYILSIMEALFAMRLVFKLLGSQS